MQTKKLSAKRLVVKGVVQGVGFRPFIYRIAKKNNLNGWVCNTSKGVIVEIVGEKKSLESFLKELKNSAPPAAKIDSIEVENIRLRRKIRRGGFEIKKSIEEKKEFQPISPDIATCNDCLKELFDPQDRRYRYPFINCTNCGPRFTIIEDIPYDRPKTTMRSFKMCKECQKEYEDPANRRFHAQPNACPKCGPEVQLVQSSELRVESLVKDKKDNVVASNSRQRRVCLRHDIEPIKGNEAIAKTIELLQQGKIVAIKGLGGFHLACDAENDRAVRELRERKLRRDKPFAVMMPDLNTVKKYCYLSDKEGELLLSPQRPIVLLKEKPQSNHRSSGISDISRFVAPYQKYQGVMLPYTPIHHLLFNKCSVFSVQCSVLVMTSGNISEEPIAMENEEAMRRLKNIADYFLIHNRDIYSRYDDSVGRVFNDEPRPCTQERGEVQILRRARSYAPYPIYLPRTISQSDAGLQSRLKSGIQQKVRGLPFEVKEIFAAGADLKNTFCLTKKNYAFLSQHIGDLENLETFEHYENTLNLYKRLFRVNPKIIAYDLHPDYLSTKYALQLSTISAKGGSASGGNYQLSTIGIQHHHAHIASCMIENNLPNSKVIGVAFDGTGYGTDEKIWGGEFLISDYQDFERVGHFSYIPMPGGEAAIRKPYRMTLSYLYALNENFPLKFFEGIPETGIKIIQAQLKAKFNSPLTSSCGRFFDAVSALLEVRKEINYEGQAAMELEMIADESEENIYPFEIDFVDNKYQINQLAIFSAILGDLKGNAAREKISAKFHNTIAQVILEICKKILQNTGIKKVCLSGGVFQNLYLMKKVVPLLSKNNFLVYYQKKVPCNDGGISLGQAIIANTRMSTNK